MRPAVFFAALAFVLAFASAQDLLAVNGAAAAADAAAAVQSSTTHGGDVPNLKVPDMAAGDDLPEARERSLLAEGPGGLFWNNGIMRGTISQLTSSGWNLYAKGSYNLNPTEQQVDTFMNSGTHMVMACGVAGSDNILMAFGRTLSLANNNRGWDSGTYWYRVNGYSWGFAEGSNIQLNTADIGDNWGQSDKRISLHLGYSSGWRCGSTTWLNNPNGANWQWYFFTASPNMNPDVSDLRVVSATVSSLSVSWECAKSDRTAGFRIKATDSDGNTVVSEIKDSNARSLTVTGLKPAYRYLVTGATIRVDNSEGAYNAKFIGYTVPVPPANLTVTFNGPDATVTYPAVQGSGIVYKVSAGQKGMGNQIYECGAALNCTITKLDLGRLYVFQMYAANAAGNSAPSAKVVARSPQPRLPALVDALYSTTVFAGASVSFGYDLQATVNNKEGLTVTLSDNQDSSVSATLGSDQHATTLVQKFSAGASGDLVETLEYTGPEAANFIKPADIPLRAIAKSRVFLNNFPQQIVAGSTNKIQVSLGVPVPEGQDLTLTITLGNVTSWTFAFDDGQAVSSFDLKLADSGDYTVSLAVSGTAAQFYDVPSDFTLAVVPKGEISIYGFRTVLPAKATVPLQVYVGIPIPDGLQLVVSFSADNDFTGSVTFGPLDVVQPINFPTGDYFGDYTLTVTLSGTAASLFNVPPAFPFTLKYIPDKTEITIDTRPTTVFAGTTVPITVNIRKAVAPARQLTVTVTGSDGKSSMAVFTSDSESLTQKLDLNLATAGDYFLSTDVSGSAAEMYVPAPAIGFKVVEGKGVPTVLGIDTEVLVMATADVTIDLGVQVPYGMANGGSALRITVTCENGFTQDLDFAEGEMQKTFQFKYGRSAGDYKLSYSYSGPAAAFYSPLPFTYVSVLER